MKRPNSEPLSIEVAKRIAAARRTRGWTQQELAERLDIATRNLQRIEGGRQNLTLETIERIAEQLDLSATALLPLSQTALVSRPAAAESTMVPAIALDEVPAYLDGREVSVEGWFRATRPEGVASFVLRLPERFAALVDGRFALFVAPAGHVDCGDLCVSAGAGRPALCVAGNGEGRRTASLVSCTDSVGTRPPRRRGGMDDEILARCIGAL